MGVAFGPPQAKHDDDDDGRGVFASSVFSEYHVPLSAPARGATLFINDACLPDCAMDMAPHQIELCASVGAGKPPLRSDLKHFIAAVFDWHAVKCAISNVRFFVEAMLTVKACSIINSQ